MRNLASIKTGFRESFAESIGNVIELVKSRFKTMKLKTENLEEYTVVSDEEIQYSLDVVSQVLISNLTVDMPTTELREKIAGESNNSIFATMHHMQYYWFIIHVCAF